MSQQVLLLAQLSFSNQRVLRKPPGRLGSYESPLNKRVLPHQGQSYKAISKSNVIQEWSLQGVALQVSDTKARNAFLSLLIKETPHPTLLFSDLTFKPVTWLCCLSYPWLPSLPNQGDHAEQGLHLILYFLRTGYHVVQVGLTLSRTSWLWTLDPFSSSTGPCHLPRSAVLFPVKC